MIRRRQVPLRLLLAHNAFAPRYNGALFQPHVRMGVVVGMFAIKLDQLGVLRARQLRLRPIVHRLDNLGQGITRDLFQAGELNNVLYHLLFELIIVGAGVPSVFDRSRILVLGFGIVVVDIGGFVEPHDSAGTLFLLLLLLLVVVVVVVVFVVQLLLLLLLLLLHLLSLLLLLFVVVVLMLHHQHVLLILLLLLRRLRRIAIWYRLLL